MSNQSYSFHLADIDEDDDLKRLEQEKTDPENSDQQGYLGSEPDPELATEKDTLEEAQEMGLYPQADEEHPVPLGEHNPEQFPD